MVTLPAPPGRPAELGLPCELTLPPDLWEALRFTPEQFEQLCEANPEAVLELTAEGHLIAITPTGGDTGRRNTRLLTRLQTWADRQEGWEVFDSSSGFHLPDGSVLSPDASVVQLARWQALAPEQRRSFPPLCPDLVVELASPSDEGPRGLAALRRKMAAYMANGARLGWLPIPQQRAAEIWQAGAEGEPAEHGEPLQPQRLEQATRLEGGELLPGLVLELQEIWEA
ncbi:MAG: Uma2 family endonuclease [Cyanobium sp.]